MSKMSRFTKRHAWVVGILAVLLGVGTVWALMIEDGAGTGRRAKVSLDNRLQTEAVMETKEAYFSHDSGKAFSLESGVSVAVTLTSTATGGYHLYLKNDSTTEDMHIERLVCSTNTAGTIIAVVKNPTLGTISNHNVTAPVNINFSSGVVSQSTSYTWNETGNGMGGITSGVTVTSRSLSVGPHIFNLEGAYILSSGNSVGVQVFGAAETTVGLRYFFAPKDM